MGLQGIGAFILVVGGLVLVHELGHFLVAKRLGVKVVRFSIGFGPRLLWWTAGGTEYRLSALPLGGYVKMAGDVPGEEPAPEDRGRGFYEQPPWKRIVIGIAGPAANFLFPILLFATIGVVQNGEPTLAAAVGAVVPGSVAEQAQLRPGDRILAVGPVGGPLRPMRWWEDLVGAISSHPGERIAVEIDRDGARQVLEMVPAAEERSNGVESETRGVIGITPRWPSRVVAPRAPGAAGPLQPFDEVTRVAGAKVAHFGELAKAFEAARCAPVDLDVRRGTGAARAAVHLTDVPTCADGRLSVLPVQDELSAVVGRVEAGGPAAAAGLARGDVIVSANGRPIRNLPDLDALEGTLKEGTPIALGLAGGRTVELVPRTETFKDRATGESVQRFVLGFGGVAAEEAGRPVEVQRVPFERGLREIVGDALDRTWRMTRLTTIGIAKIVTGKLSHRQVGGILTLFDQSAEAAAQGWETLFFWMAIVSVNLGIMNLLPIPVLDGGHVAASLIEQVTRRPLSLRVREVATYVGLFLLGLLMILAFRNDIARLMG